MIEANGQYHEGQFGFVGALLSGWLARVWWLARRRTLIDDPLLFALTDPISLLIGMMLAAVAGVSVIHSVLV